MYDLPPELLFIIFGYLNDDSLKTLINVSKYYKELVYAYLGLVINKMEINKIWNKIGMSNDRKIKRFFEINIIKRNYVNDEIVTNLFYYYFFYKHSKIDLLQFRHLHNFSL